MVPRFWYLLTNTVGYSIIAKFLRFAQNTSPQGVAVCSLKGKIVARHNEPIVHGNHLDMGPPGSRRERVVLGVEFKRLTSIAKKKKLRNLAKVALAVFAFSLLSLAMQSAIAHVKVEWVWFAAAFVNGCVSTIVAYILFKLLSR